AVGLAGGERLDALGQREPQGVGRLAVAPVVERERERRRPVAVRVHRLDEDVRRRGDGRQRGERAGGDAHEGGARAEPGPAGPPGTGHEDTSTGISAIGFSYLDVRTLTWRVQSPAIGRSSVAS